MTDRELPYRASWVEVLAPENFDAPDLQEMLDLWNAKRGARAMPARSDFDPLELQPHLGWIILIDVEHAPLRFRYRLIGTRIVALAGRDSTGRYFDELYEPEVEEVVTVSFREIVGSKTPRRVRATLEHADRGFLAFETVDLPLSSDGETVDMILVRSVFDRVG